MLIVLLIVGLVWLVVALVFVLALAAAARDRVSPEVAAAPVGALTREQVESIHSAGLVTEPSLQPVPSPVPA